jgi:hypothetical protein
VVNLVTNRVAHILGKVENTERFLWLALYQGIPGRAKRLGVGMKGPESDPTLVACAYNRQRLFLFSRREPADTDDVTTGRYGCGRFQGSPVTVTSKGRHGNPATAFLQPVSSAGNGEGS